MKNLRRAASAALAALLAGALLAGCAADESGAGPSATPAAQTTGGYVEEDITPDHNYNVGLFVVDGVLNAFTVENPATPLSQQTAHWYAMGQDGSWQEVTLRDGYGVPYEVAGETGSTSSSRWGRACAPRSWWAPPAWRRPRPTTPPTST